MQTINNKLPGTLLIGGKQIWLEILKKFNLIIEIHKNILLLLLISYIRKEILYSCQNLYTVYV
jgi:hypothetical protein